jgi:asparagine synthase (glutamine-hydrolysing)
MPKVSDGRAAYFLSRCLFLPHELEDIVAPELAAEGLRRLGLLEQLPRQPGQIKSICWTSFVAAAESTQYLRNQLLRDSDWASMAHSLELRTPLVDRHLTQSLAPFAGQFVGGVGKAYLAGAPTQPLPAEIEQAAKTGFGLPIKDWIVCSPTANTWQAVASLRGAKVPWARRWAYVVAREFLGGAKAASQAFC